MGCSKKGGFAVGSDADIVIFDPDKRQKIGVETHHMNVDYNEYEGFELQGVVETVLFRENVVIENGKYKRETRRRAIF